MKTSDEARANNAVLTADSTLTFAMAASTKYSIRCEIFYDTAATPDFQWSTSGPTSPTLVRTQRHAIQAGATAFSIVGVDTAATGAQAMTGTGTTGGYVQLTTTWENGANAGTWAFNWAQNTSNASNTTVLAGSYCDYTSF